MLPISYTFNCPQNCIYLSRKIQYQVPHNTTNLLLNTTTKKISTYVDVFHIEVNLYEVIVDGWELLSA